MTKQYRSRQDIEVTAWENSCGRYGVKFADGSIEHINATLFQRLFKPMLHAVQHESDEMRWFALPAEQADFDALWRAECDRRGLTLPDEDVYVTHTGTVCYDYDENREGLISIGIGRDSLWYSMLLHPVDADVVEEGKRFAYGEIPSGQLPPALLQALDRWAVVVGPYPPPSSEEHATCEAIDVTL